MTAAIGRDAVEGSPPLLTPPFKELEDGYFGLGTFLGLRLRPLGLSEGLATMTPSREGLLAEELREYTAMKYAGDCKCGKCQLVPRELVERIYHTLNSASVAQAPPSERQQTKRPTVTDEPLTMHDAMNPGPRAGAKIPLDKAIGNRFEGDADTDPMPTIWLQPWCKGCDKHAYGSDGRQWCENDPWGECEECGRKPVKYVLFPQETNHD